MTARAVPTVNQNLATQYRNGMSFTPAPGVNLNINGGSIADMLAPDQDQQALLNGARNAENTYQSDLANERSRLDQQFGYEADKAGETAANAFREMAAQQTNDAYGAALEQNTFNAFRGGNQNSSANAKRVSRIYESTLQKRMQDEADAQSAGEAARGQVLGLNDSLQSYMGSVMAMDADAQKALLDTYQQSQPREISELGAYLEDMLTGLGMAADARARGVDNAYGIVF